MSEIEVDELLRELSPDEPSGTDLEYDAAFTEMESASKGKAEQQFGDSVIEGEEPNWREVKQKALNVLSRSKDLRAALYLAKASLVENGLPEFRDALSVLRGLIEKFWDSVHPQLDPDDDLDPTIRVNTLMELCDVSSTLQFLKNAPLVSVRGLGSISLRDIAIASGEAEPPSGVEPLTMDAVNAAFRECDLDELKTALTAVQEAHEHATQIEWLVTDRVGPANAPNFELLYKEFKAIEHKLKERYQQRAPVAAVPEEQEVTASQPATDASAPSAATAPSSTGTIDVSKIASRDQAIKALDGIIAYFERHEPSSPLPLLLRRAKRLSKKSFLEILRDISPNGVDQAIALGGVPGDEDTAISDLAADDAATQSAPPAPSRRAETTPNADDY